MLKRTMMSAAAVAATLALPGLALAQATAPASSPHTFTGNVGLFSQYIFRGLTQTNEDPAIQGGLDYSYNFGPASVYVGTWSSNISWLRDSNQYTSSSLETDIYAGVKGPIGKSDFTYDAGFLYYWYPGDVVPATGERGDTKELYGALGWKWLTAKYSYSVGDETFAVRDSDGTWYLDLSASVPIGDTGVTLMAHWGKQKYRGSDPRNAGGRSNDAVYSYRDWKIGASYDLGKVSDVLKGTAVGGFWTDTSGASAIGYGSVAEGGSFPRNIAKSQFTVFVQKTF